MIYDIGGHILNGTTVGDKEGEYTYVGPRGNTVIDYVIINDSAYNLIDSFKVDERVDSDHVPLITWLKEEEKKRKEMAEELEEEASRIFIQWDEEARKFYKERTEGTWNKEELEKEEVEDIWNKLKSGTGGIC